MEIFILKTSRVLLVVLVLVIIGVRNGQIVGINIFESGDQGKKAAEFTLTDVNALFPSATMYRKSLSDTISVFDGSKFLGTIISSSPLADSIVGYTASVPLLLGLDASKRIVGIHLLKNYESADFVAKIKKSGFLDTWNGKTIQSGLRQKVDGISGATITSKALLSTIHFSLSRHARGQILRDTHETFTYVLRSIFAFILFAGSIFLFVYPAKLKRIRIPLQIGIIAVIGLWMGESISIQILYNWLIYGVSLSQKVLLATILLAAILLPLFTQKAFYCTYLCPYGAAQELVGKLHKRKIQIPQCLIQHLVHLREFLFGGLILLLMLGVSLDLTSVEPFAAFAFETASIPVLVFAVLFLVLSVFIPRAWCRFFCPTGQFLELIRKLLIIKNHL